jgi:endonuclease-3
MSTDEATIGRRAAAVRKRLARAIPHPRTELVHESAWQLLVATILSAQSTDRLVNRVTPTLFALWPTPAALAAATQAEVERLVRPTGFYRNKARAIRGAAAAIEERFGGEVPRTMDELVTLPGVARKTANVVLGTAFGIASGITVDTHAARVARRLGLSTAGNPVAVEADLCRRWPRRSWVDMGHRLVLHGRYVCESRRPCCAACPLNELCAGASGTAAEIWAARAEAERVHVESRGAMPLAPAAFARRARGRARR